MSLLDIFTPMTRKQAINSPQSDHWIEAEKKEMVAKHFFNLIDKDGSGTLTSYELKSAFEEYGFSAEEQETMFSLFDHDGSGSVTLNEFCQGLGKVNIQIEGRISKTSAIESHHAIALALR